MSDFDELTDCDIEELKRIASYVDDPIEPIKYLEIPWSLALEYGLVTEGSTDVPKGSRIQEYYSLELRPEASASLREERTRDYEGEAERLVEAVGAVLLMGSTGHEITELEEALVAYSR